MGGAQLAGEGEPVLARQVEVEQHEVGHLAGEAGPHGGTVAGLADPEALAGQIAGQHRADPRVVVHDQDARDLTRHGTSPHSRASHRTTMAAVPASDALVAAVGPSGPR